jgi:hypothetical protein
VGIETNLIKEIWELKLALSTKVLPRNSFESTQILRCLKSKLQVLQFFTRAVIQFFEKENKK